MRDFFVFDRSFLDYELKFFFMVNQGTFIRNNSNDVNNSGNGSGYGPMEGSGTEGLW